MRQGAYLDTSEPYQPWINLILNYIAEIIDKQEIEGSFQPLNVGTGWVIDVLDFRKKQLNSSKEVQPRTPSVEEHH